MKKNSLIIFVFILVFIYIGYDIYHSYNTKSIVQNKCIDGVEQKVEKIKESISKYSLKFKDIFDRSSEGGQQTNYSLSEKTLLIKQVFFGEMGKSEIDYFLENNKVFFFEKKNTEYVLPISEDASAKVKNVETKDFYLDGSQNLCSWFLNQNLQTNDKDTRDLVEYFILGLWE